jgi:hypothetical protein
MGMNFLKPEGKRLIEKHRRCWGDNIKINFNDIGF